MNNPGMDPENWKRINQKVDALASAGHMVKVTYKLIKSAEDKDKILLIDVIQNIDGEIVTETVEQHPDEGYAAIGIAGFSMEHLVGLYNEWIRKLLIQSHGKQHDTLIVSMSSISPTSGELKGILIKPESNLQSSVQVNYMHYYILNALREKMVEAVGDRCTQVKAVYASQALDFYFDY